MEVQGREENGATEMEGSGQRQDHWGGGLVRPPQLMSEGKGRGRAGRLEYAGDWRRLFLRPRSKARI